MRRYYEIGSLLCFEHHGQDSRVRGPLSVAPTIHRKTGTGGNNLPLVLHKGFGYADRVPAEEGACHA